MFCFAFIVCRVLAFIRYIRASGSCSLCYNEDFVISRFVISRFCSIHLTVTLVGLKSIVCYTEDFVLYRFVRFPYLKKELCSLSNFEATLMDSLPRNL